MDLFKKQDYNHTSYRWGVRKIQIKKEKHWNTSKLKRSRLKQKDRQELENL